MPTKIFGTVRQKIFVGKLWYPLLFIIFIDTPNFLKHWRDAHEIFHPCETKNFNGNLWYPLVMHKFFRYPKFSETLKGCPQNFSTLCDKKIFVGKLWYPLLFIKFFDTSNFLNHWRDAHEIFRHCETKNFRRKHVIPPIMHKIFPIAQTFWNIEGMPTKFFGTVRQNFFEGNLWYPLLCINFFDTPNFLKYWRDAHEIFHPCETKNFDGNLWYPLVMHKFFRYPKFSETLKGCPQNFSTLCDKKIFDGNLW